MHSTHKNISLDGKNLNIQTLIDLSCCDGYEITVSNQAVSKIIAAREVVDELLESGEAIYGLTTGLGAKVTEQLLADESSDFSTQTLRGRAHGIGKPIPCEKVRGAMIIRLNTLLSGASGASPEMCNFFKDCLNKNITPVIGETGSIGASDLCWGATMGLSFVGEGRMMNGIGVIGEASTILDQAGLNPLSLGPKDGLVLANHASFSAALSAFAVYETYRLIYWIQNVTAITMEAFCANLSTLDAYTHDINPQPGNILAATQLRGLLEGSRLFTPGEPRKIQDPLSIRNAVQVHGTALSALKYAQKTLEIELNACTDNPVVDVKNRRIISSGGYYSSHLTLAVETISRAMDQVVVTQLSRMAKLLSTQHSGLPRFLARTDANSNGFAPTLKIAEALVAEIKKLLKPVDLWPSINADGVEDIQSHAPLAARSLSDAIVLGEKLCALELIMACQALELRGKLDSAPVNVKNLYNSVRSVVDNLGTDRPMGNDIENLAQFIRSQKFAME